jgi:hypothetical protein
MPIQQVTLNLETTTDEHHHSSVANNESHVKSSTTFWTRELEL